MFIGVYTIEPDITKSEVNVKGVFDPQNLLETIKRKMGKHVGILKVEPVIQVKKVNNNKIQKDINKDKEDKCADQDKVVFYVYNPPPHLENGSNCLLFNDENANSCSIM